MNEISLHILDIVANSIVADAQHIAVHVQELSKTDRFIVSIRDDGRGIDPKILPAVADPFVSTKPTRRAGLGLSLLENACTSTGGKIEVQSDFRGTVVTAIFRHSHIDRLPLGDLASTIMALVASNPGLAITYRHEVNSDLFEFDVNQLSEWFPDLGYEALFTPVVLQWLRRYLEESIELLRRRAHAQTPSR